MDAQTAEKISQLAKSLKQLHLASTIDEATERAKEIILSSEQREQKTVNDIERDVKNLQRALLQDKLDHDSEIQETIDVKKKIKQDQEKADELKEIIQLADELQK